MIANVNAITIPVSDELRRMLNRTPDEFGRDVRLYAAMMFFKQGKLSSGAAAELAGVARVMFLDICAEHGIIVSQITSEELKHEVECQVTP